MTDVDGNVYADLCLGDTGAMAGHAPAPVLEAVAARYGGGGNDDAADRGRRLGRGRAEPPLRRSCAGSSRSPPPTPTASRSGSPATSPAGPRSWSSTTATTAPSTSRFATLADGEVDAREGNVGAPCAAGGDDPRGEFNDLAGLERELAAGDVACVLAEPALTNIGIVLPDAGLPRRAARADRAAGTLLIIDETHTLSAGPGGCTRRWGLRARHGHARQGDRRRRPDRRLRDATARSASGCSPPRRRPRGHRRRRRHPGRQRALARRRPRDPRPRCSTDAAWERTEPLGDPLRRGRRGRDRAPRRPLARGPARLPRRVPLLPRAAPRRRRRGGARRRGARALPAPLRAQPRRPHHPLPQHGADLPGDDRRSRSTATPRPSTPPCARCSAAETIRRWKPRRTTPTPTASASPTRCTATGRSTSSSCPASSPTSSCSGRSPTVARFLRRLASFSRLVIFDKRGQGLSDRTGRPPTLEESMDDLEAVMEAAGCERPAIFGISEGGPMSALFAATHPEPGLLARPLRDLRADAGGARTSRPGSAEAALDRWGEIVRRDWGGPVGSTSGRRAGSATASSNAGGRDCCARGRAPPGRSP